MSQLMTMSSAERKAVPVTTGVWDYFPDALVEVARVSKAGNDKHNPGQPLHHSRGKSTDHADSIGRHLIDRGKIDPDTGMLHSAELAWRALANLQQELEDKGLAEMPRAASYDEAHPDYDRPPRWAWLADFRDESSDGPVLPEGEDVDTVPLARES